MTLFLKAYSLYRFFTQLPKTFNSTVDFLKHLGDVVKVLLDLISVCSVSSCHSKQSMKVG